MQLTSPIVNVWHDIIGNLDFDLAQRALRYCLANCKFQPKPADILEAAREIQKSPGEKITPEEAYATCCKLAGTFGYEQIERAERMLAERPRTLRAARAIGWFRICYSNLDTDGPFLLRDFKEAYENISDGEEQELKLNSNLKILPGPDALRISNLVKDLSPKR